MVESVLNISGKARKIAWKLFSTLACHSTGSCLFRLSKVITIDKSFLPLELHNQPEKKKDVLENECVFKYTEKDNCIVTSNNIISCYFFGIFSPKTAWGKPPTFKVAMKKIHLK